MCWCWPMGPPLTEVECSLGPNSVDALLAMGHAPRDDRLTGSRSLARNVSQYLSVRYRSFGFTRTIRPHEMHRSQASAVVDLMGPDYSGQEAREECNPNDAAAKKESDA